jgi:hypothetical protein
MRLKQSVSNAENKGSGPEPSRHALFDNPWTIQLFDFLEQTVDGMACDTEQANQGKLVQGPTNQCGF